MDIDGYKLLRFINNNFSGLFGDVHGRLYYEANATEKTFFFEKMGLQYIKT